MTTELNADEEKPLWSPRITRAFISGVIFLQIAFGIAYATKVPLWMPSDERAHFAYVKDVMKTGQMHVFDPRDGQYEAIQPPLFYFVDAFLCKTVVPNDDIRSQTIFLRFVGLAFFVATSIIVFGIFTVSKENNVLGLSAGACYALSPVMLGILTTVINDSLYFLLAALVFYFLARLPSGPPKLSSCAIVGLISGFGMLTKLTFITVVGASALYLLLRAKPAGLRRLIQCLLSFSVPVTLLFVPLLIWNLSVYHTLTAYGSVAKYLLHGPLKLDHLGSFFLGTVAYHLIPSEFWLNQIQTPGFLKTIILLVVLLAPFGVLASACSKERLTELTKLCFLSHPAAMLFWLVIISTTSIDPVRIYFGTYFGFCYFAAVGFFYSLKRWLPSSKVRNYVCLSLPILFVAINVYLLCVQVPNLTDGGLLPPLSNMHTPDFQPLKNPIHQADSEAKYQLKV